MEIGLTEDRLVKILFVIPPYFDIDDYTGMNKTSVIPAFTIPYGILSLDAFLKAKCVAKVSVDVIDLNIEFHKLLSLEEKEPLITYFIHLISARVKELRPNITGFSALFNSSFKHLEKLAEAVRQVEKDTLIIAGGGLPSAAFEQIFESCPSIDAICKGEGEIPLVELVDADDKINLLLNHPSWITRDGLLRGKIPKHTFVWDLDEIPMLDYDILNLDDYNCRSIDKRFSNTKKREMSIHTSRGCPFVCVFCSNPSLHGKKVRTMSVERVINEVRRMKEQFGLTVLLIEDDHFFHDKDHAKEILRQLAQFSIRVEFPNGVAVYAIDDEVSELLSKAGVSTVALAVESGSDYVLNHIIKKPLKTNLVKPAVESLRKYGIMCHVFIVIGLPGEMPEHRQQTLDLLNDVGFDWAHIFCASPIFGSRLYDICVENGYLTNANLADYVVTKAVIKAPGVDPDEIKKTAYEMNLLVNFINNYNLRMGNFEIAEKYFTNVISKYPEHAFGYYSLARVFEGVGKRTDEIGLLYEKFNLILNRDSDWKDYAKKYILINEEEVTLIPTLEKNG